MRKFTLLFSLVFITVISTEVNAQWSNTGNNQTTGTLRVGATIPFSTKKLIVRANNTDAVAWLDNINTFGTGLIISSGQDILRLGSKNNELGNVMMVKADGRVGIGTTSPTTGYKLDINGDTRSNGDIFLTGSNSISAAKGYIDDIYYYGLFWQSDRNLKKDIQEDFSSFRSIYNMKTYSYKYKKDEEERNQFGVMAQDIEKIFPDMVSEGKDGLAVNYTAIIPLLIRAVQDQKQTIESLENRLEKLTEKINENPELAELMDMDENRMTIFPNPSSNATNVTLKGSSFGNVSLQVVNLNGEVVQRVSAQANSTAQIDTSKLLKGVYFVRYLKDGKVLETKRLLIEK